MFIAIKIIDWSFQTNVTLCFIVESGLQSVAQEA